MSAKVYNVVGVSRVRAGADMKLRVANGKPARRARILERNGHADIMLVSVDPAVTKDNALTFLQTNHPELAAKLKAKKTTAKTPAVENVKAPAKKATTKPAAATGDVELSADAKLALRRAKDAARKREKRQAEKARREAAATAA